MADPQVKFGLVEPAALTIVSDPAGPAAAAAAAAPAAEAGTPRKHVPVGTLIMVAGKLKRKKKKPKKKKKGFFDDSYVAAEKKAVEVAAHLKLGEQIMEKAGAATDAELAQAEASFRVVLGLEPANMHARVSVKKAATAMEVRAEERKQERRKVLMQKRYGPNWATEMGCEQTCTDKDLREVFDIVDADGGGALDREEVATLADFFGDASMTEAQIDEAMAEMDDDGSGEVDFAEFLMWYHSRDARKLAKEEALKEEARKAEAATNAPSRTTTKPQERTGDVDVDDPAFAEKLRQIFDRYDDDGSGEIDAEELGQIFEVLGQPMEEGALMVLVQEIDVDGSGLIDFEEFLQVAKSTDGGAAAAVLRDQVFGEMDVEERHMCAFQSLFCSHPLDFPIFLDSFGRAMAEQVGAWEDLEVPGGDIPLGLLKIGLYQADRSGLLGARRDVMLRICGLGSAAVAADGSAVRCQDVTAIHAAGGIATLGLATKMGRSGMNWIS